MEIIFNSAGWINFRKLINTYIFLQVSFTNWCFIINICIIHMHFRHYSLRIKISFKISSCISHHWNLFWSKSSMELSPEFHGTFWTTFEQRLWFHEIPWNLSNKTSCSMEFHGILSRSKVPWNSMELFPYSRVPRNSMEFHGTFNFPPKSSMNIHGTFLKFHGIPWNSIELDKFHI